MSLKGINNMHPLGQIVLPEQGPAWEMEPGRPATFKLLSEQTGETVAVFEEVVPAGAGTPLHRHLTSNEVIYIQDGMFKFKLGEQVATGRAGTWVFIPQGTVHGWKNIGSEAGKAFYIFSPAEGAKVFETLGDLQLPFTALDQATLDSVYQRYGYELVAFDWE
jgi:quercetin dioxygenase-like cupin family protein